MIVDKELSKCVVETGNVGVGAEESLHLEAENEDFMSDDRLNRLSNWIDLPD